MRFAEVLRVRDLRELTGLPLALSPDGWRGHRAAGEVRDALLDHDAPASECPALDELASRIEQAWQAWQEASAFRYGVVGQQLPHLIAQVGVAIRSVDGAERHRVLQLASKLYQLVRTWTKRVGEYELSLLAADRAVNTALEADDRDLSAAAAWNLGLILSAHGKTESARGVVYKAIDKLQPYLDGADARRMAVFGALHLLGATEAARDDCASEATRLLQIAGRLAKRTGETNHFRLVFGPTNVALHRISVAVELGRTREALALADAVAIDDSPAVERRITFCLDTAQCYIRERNDIAAVHMLHRAHRESPEEMRNNPVARETLRQLVGRASPSTRTDLHPLAEAAGIPD